MTLIDTAIPDNQVTPEALRESLTIGVRVWKEYDAETADLQAKYDAAKAAFEAEHASLIKKLETTKAAASNAKQVLQDKAVELYKLTGEKTWAAFQCAEGWTLQFDERVMLDWALNEAPGNIRRELVALNTRAVDKLLRARIEEGGTIKAWEGCKAPPAIGLKNYTGKVLTDKIATLLAVEPAITMQAGDTEQGIAAANALVVAIQEAVGKPEAPKQTEEPIPF